MATVPVQGGGTAPSDFRCARTAHQSLRSGTRRVVWADDVRVQRRRVPRPLHLDRAVGDRLRDRRHRRRAVQQRRRHTRRHARPSGMSSSTRSPCRSVTRRTSPSATRRLNRSTRSPASTRTVSFNDLSATVHLHSCKPTRIRPVYARAVPTPPLDGGARMPVRRYPHAESGSMGSRWHRGSGEHGGEATIAQGGGGDGCPLRRGRLRPTR